MNRLSFASTQFPFSLAVTRNFMVPFFGYVSSLGGTAFQSPFLMLGGVLFLYIFFHHLMNRLSCASTQFSFSLAVARNFMVPFFGYVSSLGGTAFQSPFLVLGGLLFLYIFFRHLMNCLLCASTQFSFSYRTDSHTIPYPSQGVPLMAGSGFLANNDSEQVLVCVRIDISTLLLIFTHQHTFVTFDNVEKY